MACVRFGVCARAGRLSAAVPERCAVRGNRTKRRQQQPSPLSPGDQARAVVRVALLMAAAARRLGHRAADGDDGHGCYVVLQVVDEKTRVGTGRCRHCCSLRAARGRGERHLEHARPLFVFSGACWPGAQTQQRRSSSPSFRPASSLRAGRVRARGEEEGREPLLREMRRARAARVGGCLCVAGCCCCGERGRLP